jgi:RND family efflux transporter MFP subunit
MSTDQAVVESQPIDGKSSKPAPEATARGRGGRGVVLLILLGLAAIGGGGYYMFAAGGDREGRSRHPGSTGTVDGGTAAGMKPRVDVVKPRRGGMARVTSQPGTVFAFDYARLYAKVSGYVEKLTVDRGSRVKRDDLLVKLYVPELAAAVTEAEAALVRAKAAVDQATAQVDLANERIKASLAYELEAESKLKAAVAQRTYRDKQYHRIRELVERGSVERRLEDEELDRFETAQAETFAAQAGVETAKAKVAEARAELAKAKADLEGARADVQVRDANLTEKRTWLSYTELRSPYDGVVIFRGEAVHRGAFIQSADKGALGDPILTVARDDVMRTVIPVPDRDVPYCDLGAPAIIRVDALDEREFKGTVSRIAESEDVNDRTMRVEVDLPNPAPHVLRDGMYGRAEIVLEKTTSNLTVPSTAVVDRNSKGEGHVQVVRDGKVFRQAVKVGRDTGVLAEIISGLDADTLVVVHPEMAMADGTAVDAEPGTYPEVPPSAESEHA